MASYQSLTTNNYRLANANRLINSISSGDDLFYFFTGSSVPFTNNLVPVPVDDVFTSIIDVWSSMGFGKTLTPSNVSLAINNNAYAAGTIYAAYDDSNPLLLEQQFFTVVNDISYYHVYKCISNNNGIPSTIQPSFTSVNYLNNMFQTSDGYIWKYMFSIDSTSYNNFATPQYIPYIVNTEVTQLATSGSVDFIDVTSGGAGYSNYLTGTFSLLDISIGGNTVVYNVNATAYPLNSYYDGCYLYITADPNGAAAGQFRQIEAYTVNATSKTVQLNAPFYPAPRNGAQYTINPGVIITGDGNQTIQASAQAVINSISGNSVAYIDILNPGLGYTYLTANVFTSGTVGVSNPAVLRPIYSPPGGHGSNVPSELGSSAVSVYVTLNQSEGNTIPTDSDYQKIGLLRNPTFQNVKITLSNVSSAFIITEPIFIIDPIQIAGIAIGSTTTANISATGSLFTQSLVGENLLLSNGSSYQLGNVATVVNSSFLTLTSNCLLNSSGISLYQTEILGQAVVESAYSTTIIANNLNRPIGNSSIIIGGISGCYALANVVTRGDVQKGFNTFLQANKYTGLQTSGTFLNNETIYQGTAYGTVLSVNNNSGILTLLVTNQIGVINASSVVVGNTSGAVATLTGFQPPELVFASGDIEYIENSNPVQRQYTQSETFKLILQF